MNVINELKNPSLKYRPVPFWSWNDRLDPQELRHQINLMHEAGLGGYFMHARGGLLTDYLGDEWFECVKASIDEGGKLGMNSWAYDENGWPSGFGDGKVNGLGLAYQQKYLRLKPVAARDAVRDEHTIAFFSADGSQIVADPAAGTGGELLHCYFDVNPYYVDTLDREVTQTFIDKIYLEYRNRTNDAEWRGMAGFFTDEPQVSRNGIPWSFILEKEYRAAYGEELLPLLPQLLMNVGNFSRTRYRFWRLITELFMNNFMKPIYDWCEKHGSRITGHHVLEETYHSQITSNGAVMPQYQYYHIPGMDWLGRRIKPVTTPVQVASVCAQTGKKQILSETFALCGWNVKLEELKWMYQWQMVHGINLLCQHLESYSLKGIRKRDYPASLFRHQPWWPDYRSFNDYVSRLGVLLAEGQIRTDVVILHGQSSAWLEFAGHDTAAIKGYFDSFNRLSELFDIAHVNYHYGDETMIAMHGKVADGKFVIGRQSYGLVVVPQLRNYAPEVFARLQEFVARGGTVLAVRDRVGGSEALVGGETSAALSALTGQFVWFDSEAELTAALPRYTAVCPVVKAGTPDGEADAFAAQLTEVAFTKRHFADFNGAPATVYYFTNNDLHHGYAADIHLDATGVERFDPMTGNLEPIHFRPAGNRIAVPHYFSPAGDLVLVAGKQTAAPAATPEYFRQDPAELKTSFAPVDLGGSYRIADATANLLTLDYCEFSFDGERQEENGYVMCIQDRMLRLKRPVELEMTFRFRTAPEYPLQEELFLIMEIPEQFGIKVNGTGVPSTDCGFLFDPAFRKIDIARLVKHGENTITLKTLFTQPDQVYQCIEAAKVFEAEKNKLSYTMEIESVYLAGKFGVRTTGKFEALPREAVRCAADVVLTRAPEAADLDRVHEADLPFFAGRLTLTRDFRINPGEEKGRYLIFDRQMSIVSKIRLNGKELSPFIWHPFCVRLDGMLNCGDNRIEIELTNSLRNMLGPHHLAEGESYAVGPFSFYNESGVFARNWDGNATPWNRDYCIAEFGLDHLRLI